MGIKVHVKNIAKNHAKKQGSPTITKHNINAHNNCSLSLTIGQITFTMIQKSLFRPPSKKCTEFQNVKS